MTLGMAGYIWCCILIRDIVIGHYTEGPKAIFSSDAFMSALVVIDFALICKNYLVSREGESKTARDLCQVAQPDQLSNDVVTQDVL